MKLQPQDMYWDEAPCWRLGESLCRKETQREDITEDLHVFKYITPTEPEEKHIQLLIVSLLVFFFIQIPP